MRKKAFCCLAGLIFLSSGAAFAQTPGAPKTPGPWVQAQLKKDRYPADPGTSPSRGPADASITIVEWVDYDCPYCVDQDKILKKLLAAYPTQVRLVVKNLPLTNLHPGAKKKAVLADCMNMQGKFWQAHDKLMANAPLKQVRAGANESELNAAIAKGGSGQVEKDMAQAKHLGLVSTPSFDIRGMRQQGEVNFDHFRNWVEAMLANTAAKKEGGEKTDSGEKKE